MSPRSSSVTVQIHQQLGAVTATQEAQADQLARIDETLREDRRVASEDRRLMLDKLDALADRLAKIEPVVSTLPARVATLETEASASRLFRSRVGAVVGLAGSAAAILSAGAWYLVSAFWGDALALLKRLLP